MISNMTHLRPEAILNVNLRNARDAVDPNMPRVPNNQQVRKQHKTLDPNAASKSDYRKADYLYYRSDSR